MVISVRRRFVRRAEAFSTRRSLMLSGAQGARTSQLFQPVVFGRRAHRRAAATHRGAPRGPDALEPHPELAGGDQRGLHHAGGDHAQPRGERREGRHPARAPAEHQSRQAPVPHPADPQDGGEPARARARLREAGLGDAARDRFLVRSDGEHHARAARAGEPGHQAPVQGVLRADAAQRHFQRARRDAARLRRVVEFRDHRPVHRGVVRGVGRVVPRLPAVHARA